MSASPLGLVSGDLLIATAEVDLGYFGQTVILLLDTDESGALGVVLNRRSQTEVMDVLPQWRSLLSEPQCLFAGGPVSTNGAVCVARLADRADEPPGWRRVIGDIGLLHLDTPVELAAGAYSQLRIFAGYAGWEPGQLEGELLRGSWFRASARTDDVFTTSPDTLWRRVLRRQPVPASLTSTWVDDPEVN